MDQLRAQLWTHLDWLESRGLTGALAFAARPTAAVPDAPPPQPQSKWRLGFYSSSDLREEEVTMVTRIAVALGLSTSDFHIWAEDSLVRIPQELLNCPIIVALGPGSGQTLLAAGQGVAMNSEQVSAMGSPLLTIPHPRAMLQEPILKTGAWAALQKLKAAHSLF